MAHLEFILLATIGLIVFSFNLYGAINEGKIRSGLFFEYDKERNPILFRYFFVFNILFIIIFCFMLVGAILY
jgi:hypothetical protein